MATTLKSAVWWQRDGLQYRNASLFVDNCNLYDVISQLNKPCYFYSFSRIKSNIERLSRVFKNTNIDHKIFYAVKANRHPALLTYLRCLNMTGVDCCSPRELLLSRQLGFAEEEVSYTSVSMSKEDINIISKHQNILINCDSLTQIKRIGEQNPGREIGIRVNLEIGYGYQNNPDFQYSGSKATKFGIYKNSFLEALEIANFYDLKVVGLHCHSGWNLLNHQLPIFKEILKRLDWFLEKVDDIKYLNLGGGLGVPITIDDEPLSLEKWMQLIVDFYGKKKFSIYVEPGTYLVEDAGVFVVKVDAVERKNNSNFIYVNAGYNLNPNQALYELPFEIIPLVKSQDSQCNEKEELVEYTIAGNINESMDVFKSKIHLPRVLEGDYLALLNTGAYGASMSSNHCMRGDFYEYMIFD